MTHVFVWTADTVVTIGLVALILASLLLHIGFAVVRHYVREFRTRRNGD